MSLAGSDLIIIVIGSALAFMTVILIIWEAEREMYVLGLRPSESVSTDIAGLITASKGIAGRVWIRYRPRISGSVIYNVTIRNDTVCVTSQARHRVSDCSSTVAGNVEGPYRLINATDFGVEITRHQYGSITVVLKNESEVWIV